MLQKARYKREAHEGLKGLNALFGYVLRFGVASEVFKILSRVGVSEDPEGGVVGGVVDGIGFKRGGVVANDNQSEVVAKVVILYFLSHVSYSWGFLPI